MIEATDQRIVGFVDEGLGNSSYLVDCGDGVGVIIDPVRDVTPYVAEAARRNLRITHAIETHLHADFISGSPEMAARGVRVIAASGARLAVPHLGVGNGEEIAAGSVTFRAVATPGHTPEHLSWLMLDDGRPVALFSGGALLPGAVARTDLVSPAETEPLARALYRSVRAAADGLPDEVAIYPTHGAGSFCSAGSAGARTTTLGIERAVNALFTTDEDAFVTELVGRYGTYPTYFLLLREKNRERARVTPEAPIAKLSVEDSRRALDAGAELIDVRSIDAWASAHIPGSLSIELRPAFASWLGWLVDIERPLVFVLDPAQDRRRLAIECRKIGYERIVGEVDGGVDAWRDAGLPLERVPTLRVEDVTTTLVDVRQDSEYDAGHVPGAMHVELGTVSHAASVLPGGELAVMCGHGERAATAASLLLRSGRRDVTVLLGGPRDWARAREETLERRDAHARTP